MNPGKPLSEVNIVSSLALLYVFRMLGLFMVFPVMMLFGAQYHGATPFLLGVALGCYGLTQAVLQIPMGLMSDIWGRKPIIILGLTLFMLGSVVAALADSVWGLIIGRALQGAGAIASAVMALVGDLTAEQNRTKAMAAIGASIGLSFSVAMVLGPVLAGLGGLSLIFWVSAALAILGMLILWLRVPSPPKTRNAAESIAIPGMLSETIRNTDLLRLNFGIFVLHFVLTATFVVVPFVLADAGVDSDAHWTYYLPVMALAFIAMLPFMYIAERKRKIKHVFAAAVALLLVAEASMAQAGDKTPLAYWVGGLFLFFTAFNLLEATLPSLISKQAPAGSKGTAMGVYSTCQFLGAGTGGLVGGWCLQVSGLSSVLWVSAVLTLLWFVVALGMRQPRYLRSISIPMMVAPQEQQLRDQVPGVVELLWIADQSLLHLKVDESRFSRATLNEFLGSKNSDIDGVATEYSCS